MNAERKSRSMPKLDEDLSFNPLDKRFLRSREGREIPPSSGRHVAGAIYPEVGDLESLLREDQSGVRLPWACPVVATPNGAREVLYSRTITLPQRRRDAHIAAWGPTGSGKSTEVTQPLLLSDLQEANRCVVSASLKGEEYPLIAGYCATNGIELQYLDLSDPTRSLGFNPLDDDESNVYDVISSFISLVVNHESHDSEFWRQSGTAFMVGAWHSGCRSFASILDFFEAPRQEMLKRLDGCDNASARSTAAFLRSGSQNADTTVASVIGWLNPFRDPAVRATTGRHELDKRSLFRNRRVLVIRCPEPRLTTLRPIYNLLIQWLLDAAIATADDQANHQDRPSVSVFIEDLPAWGPIPSLVDRLATLRSRRISVIAAIQSMAQLRLAYGSNAEAVEKSFVNKIVLPGVDQGEAEFFARCSGEEQVALARDGGDVLNEVIIGRTVLSASDIRNPRWRHFLLGQPVTFVLQDVVFQAYLCPIYLNPDAIALMAPGSASAQPPERSVPLAIPIALTVADRPGTSHFTDTQKITPKEMEDRLTMVREHCDWPNTTGSARKWWEAFEAENAHRRELVLHLLEELKRRKATITEFFLSYVYSNTDNIQANLSYLDYSRVKKEEEKRKREAALKARESGTTDAPLTHTESGERQDGTQAITPFKKAALPPASSSASDASELTFVFCQACRSLIPSQSTRCRLCGEKVTDAQATSKQAATLDNSTPASDPSKRKKQSRGKS